MFGERDMWVKQEQTKDKRRQRELERLLPEEVGQRAAGGRPVRVTHPWLAAVIRFLY